MIKTRLPKRSSRFLNKDEGYYLTTNAKVMLTTLCNQKNLERLNSTHFAGMVWRDFILMRKRAHYFLVRNPYDRIVSFYADKFRQSPLRRTEEQGWQNCQRIFFAHLKISDNTPFDKVRERFLSVSFEEFIKLLPGLYLIDGHLRPQSSLLRARIKNIPISGLIKFKRIYRMEKDLSQLGKDLKIDISIKYQVSRHASSEEYFTPSLRKIVNELYYDDFLLGGYEILIS